MIIGMGIWSVFMYTLIMGVLNYSILLNNKNIEVKELC